jgi:hypothetical protein
MFGLVSSTGVFGLIADMVLDIYKVTGFTLVTKWVDNFIAFCTPSQQWSEEDFMQITEEFGIPWSREKLRRFAPIQCYIGLDWDLNQCSVLLPEEKLTKVKVKIQIWFEAGMQVTTHDSASLHGKLVYSSFVFPLIWPFLQLLMNFAQKFKSGRAKLAPPLSTLCDLLWVQPLQHILNMAPNHWISNGGETPAHHLG